MKSRSMGKNRRQGPMEEQPPSSGVDLALADLISVKEAAALLLSSRGKTSTSTVRQLMESGKLPKVYGPGGGVFTKRSALLGLFHEEKRQSVATSDHEAAMRYFGLQ